MNEMKQEGGNSSRALEFFPQVYSVLYCSDEKWNAGASERAGVVLKGKRNKFHVETNTKKNEVVGRHSCEMHDGKMA
jgi:hypothetical protein